MGDCAHLTAAGRDHQCEQVEAWLALVKDEARGLACTRAQARSEYGRMLSPSGICYEGRDMPGSPNAYGDAIPDGLARVEELQGSEAFVDMGLLAEAVSGITSCLHGRARLLYLAWYVGVTGGVGLSSAAFAGPLTWNEMESAFGLSKSGMERIMKPCLHDLWDGMPHRFRDPGSQALPEM